MVAKRIWEPWQNAAIERMWKNGETINLIAFVCDVPHSAIEKQRVDLGLKRRRKPFYNQKLRKDAWSIHENDLFLRMWYEERTLKEIYNALLDAGYKRTWSSIENRPNMLKLKPRRPQGADTRVVTFIMLKSEIDILSKMARSQNLTRSKFIVRFLQNFIQEKFASSIAAE